jgi:predicted PurR-regulated permease PerM
MLVHPFMADATRMVKSLSHQAGSWQQYLASAQEYISQLPPGLQDALKQYRLESLAARIPPFLTGFLHTSAEWITFLIDVVLIPILAFYLIVEARGLKREYIGLVPGRWRRDAIAITRSAARIMRDYTLANLVLCLIAGVAVYIGLSLLHVPYALSLSVLAGITRFVPVIGPIIGAIPILLLSLGQGVSVAAGVLVFFIILHLVESKLLLPKLIGDRLHIHGALVLIVLLLGGEFAGIPGMFIAAPLAALVRVILRTYVLRIRRGEGPRPPAGPSRPGRRSEAARAGAVRGWAESRPQPVGLPVQKNQEI